MAALSSTGAVVEIADAAQWVRKSPSPCMRRPVWDGFWEMDSRHRTRLANAFRESAPSDGIVRRPLHSLNIRPWVLVLFLMLMSLVLLSLFEVEANREGGTYYGDRIFGAIATQLRTSSWVPAVVALGFATRFIYYLLDPNVYLMRDPQVRAAAWGLVRNGSKISRRI